MEIIIYSQCYRTRAADRQLEINECLRRNLNHPGVSRIVLFCESDPGCDNRIAYVLWSHLYSGVTYVHPSLAPIEQGVHQQLRHGEAEVAHPQASVHSRTSILSKPLPLTTKRDTSSTIANRPTKPASTNHHSRGAHSQAISIKAQGDPPAKLSRQKRMTFWRITQSAGLFDTKTFNPTIKTAMAKLKPKVTTIIADRQINNLKSFLSCEHFVHLILGDFSNQAASCHD